MTKAAADFATLEAALDGHRRRVDEALIRLAPRQDPPNRVGDAVRHSLSAPAKRLRPILAMMVTEILRGNVDSTVPAGCAIEMVHTASLILDDLPAMDDAQVRRGRPACHVVYGEAAAILAAFALLNHAFALLAEGWVGGPDATTRALIGCTLAGAVGMDGMITGQAVDLEMTDRQPDFATLEFIHSRKTGALFTAAASIGARIAGADPAAMAAVTAYAKNLGLAFQIIDDRIDASGEKDIAGKDVRKDLKKTTFVSFAGLEGALTLARELADTSVDALRAFGARADPLRELARYVVVRRK